MTLTTDNYKHALRVHFHRLRETLSHKRRQEAEINSLESVKTISRKHSLILSYASFSSELNTWKLNRSLASEGKLVLPKIEQNLLHLYHIENLDKQLIKNLWGIYEPNPKKCEMANISDVTLAFVPGLCFDKNKNRLGYGKGFYDRFLSSISHPILSIGLGFKEQLSQTALPKESTDVLLSSIMLY